jgi:hypothetical protein
MELFDYKFRLFTMQKINVYLIGTICFMSFSGHCYLRICFRNNYQHQNPQNFAVAWKDSKTIYNKSYCIFFWQARVCWPLLCLCHPLVNSHCVLLRDVWIRTQRSAGASRGDTNFAPVFLS